MNFVYQVVYWYSGILFNNKREKLLIDAATWMRPPLQIMLSERNKKQMTMYDMILYT